MRRIRFIDIIQSPNKRGKGDSFEKEVIHPQPSPFFFLWRGFAVLRHLRPTWRRPSRRDAALWVIVSRKKTIMFELDALTCQVENLKKAKLRILPCDGSELLVKYFEIY
ncbi:hypothetical protein TNIN_5781 [Trichonephila inaurata madagascariensis]|uniref:Uncharacterized protein n=1 Tax=Trichonephila inaurata madagascariensis TaxID=2747483 RepID=A0A8X6XVV8_9ARAC|nr:hypothetical protein TNIN_5781 [Trichonephila inaurata madagascariensis]